MIAARPPRPSAPAPSCAGRCALFSDDEFVVVAARLMTTVPIRLPVGAKPALFHLVRSSERKAAPPLRRPHSPSSSSPSRCRACSMNTWACSSDVPIWTASCAASSPLRSRWCCCHHSCPRQKRKTTGTVRISQEDRHKHRAIAAGPVPPARQAAKVGAGHLAAISCQRCRYLCETEPLRSLLLSCLGQQWRSTHTSSGCSGAPCPASGAKPSSTGKASSMHSGPRYTCQVHPTGLPIWSTTSRSASSSHALTSMAVRWGQRTR